MSGGGGQSVTNDPWKGAQPYLKDAMAGVAGVYGSGGPGIYVGPTTVGYTPYDAANYQNQLNYANLFAGAGSPLMGAMGAAQGAFGGSNPLAQFGGQLSQQALAALGKAPVVSGGVAPPGGGVPAAKPAEINPGLSFGGLDASAAIQQMLSGRQGMDSLSSALQASDNQLLRNFQNTVIPGLNDRTIATNNQTGAIKGLNWGVGQLGQSMADARNQILAQAQQQANAAQSGAASMLTGAGMQAAQLQAQQQNQALANQIQSAGLDLQGQQLAQAAQAQAQNYGLGLGQLSASTLGQGASNAAQWASLYPGLAQLGMLPANITGQNTAMLDQSMQQQLSDAINQFNQYQQQPQNMAQWYLQNIQGTAGLGGTQKQSGGGGGAMGGLGGAMAGAQLGSMFGPIGTGIGAIGGGILGLFG